MKSEAAAMCDLVRLGGVKHRVLGALALSSCGLLGWMLFAEQYYNAAADSEAHQQARGLGGIAKAPISVLADAGPPAYLNPVQLGPDGFRLTRITAPGQSVPKLDLRWSEVARHHYSLDQPWNADQSLLMLDRGTPGHLFVDGQTFEPEFVREPPGESRWHPQIPGTQILLDGQTLNFWDVRSNSTIPIETFSDYRRLAFGPNKGNLSHDGRMIALLAEDARGREVVFAYDLVTRRKYQDIDLSGKEIDHVTISPSGQYIVVRGRLWNTVNLKGDQTEILDVFGRRVGPAWDEYGRPSHFDLGFDEQGEEVAVGVSKSPPESWQVIKRRLRDGAVVSLSRPGAATHVSLRAITNPGWAFVTFGDREHREGWLPYHREIVAIKLDGSGETMRIAPTHSSGKPYVAEAHGVPSPDGCKVMFASDWGIKGGDISTYVAESPTCHRSDRY